MFVCQNFKLCRLHVQTYPKTFNFWNLSFFCKKGSKLAEISSLEHLSRYIEKVAQLSINTVDGRFQVEVDSTWKPPGLHPHPTKPEGRCRPRKGRKRKQNRSLTCVFRLWWWWWRDRIGIGRHQAASHSKADPETRRHLPGCYYPRRVLTQVKPSQSVSQSKAIVIIFTDTVE